VIVVVGSPRARSGRDGPVEAAGLAALVAAAGAQAGSLVEIVGRVGEDAAGEAVLLDLARRGVRHVAVLRDAERPTAVLPADIADDLEAESDPEPEPRGNDAQPTLDAADLELALSYLPEYAVIVVAEPLSSSALRVVAEAAGWSEAALVVVGAAADLAGLPDNATVFAPPDGDPDGAFAAMVGAYAAGLDRGDDPRAAFAAATTAVASSPAD
jgi:sugar/nucleoside kinase (ribokinase family)